LSLQQCSLFELNLRLFRGDDDGGEVQQLDALRAAARMLSVSMRMILPNGLMSGPVEFAGYVCDGEPASHVSRSAM
jgi:hypothetical protein